MGRTAKMEKGNLFAHSLCCNAHWELMYSMDTKQWSLVCEECKKPVGGITLSGPQIDGKQCACCGEELTKRRIQ
jgi:rRNA maturation endonuclease Nob1